MNTPRCVLVLVASFACAASLAAADQPSLHPRLEPLRPFLEKTWTGAFKNSTPEKPVVDVMRWERALNGKAVRILINYARENPDKRDEIFGDIHCTGDC